MKRKNIDEFIEVFSSVIDFLAAQLSIQLVTPIKSGAPFEKMEFRSNTTNQIAIFLCWYDCHPLTKNRHCFS